MNKETIHEILPLGTILTLQGGTKKLMIIGRIQEDKSSKKIYDYAACFYPEGLLDPEELYLFQHEDIDLIFYVGMQESEEFAFRSFIEEKLIEMNLL